MKNQVTDSLTAITVIIVGVVNCFLPGLMREGRRGRCDAIREAGRGERGG